MSNWLINKINLTINFNKIIILLQTLINLLRTRSLINLCNHLFQIFSLTIYIFNLEKVKMI